MRRLIALLFALAGCKSPPPPPPTVPLTDGQKAEVRKLIEATRARIGAAAAKRDQAFAAAASLRWNGKPCPVSREQLGIAADITHNGLTAKLLGMTRVVSPAAPAAASKAMSDLDTEAMLIERHLDEPQHYGAAYFRDETKRKLDALAPQPFELALVLSRYTDPKRMTDRDFAGGELRGVLFLWSEAAGAIVCAAPASGQSASEVTTTVSSFGGRPSEEEVRAYVDAHLTGELFVRTIDSGIDLLMAAEAVKAAPPPTPRHPSKK